MNPIVAGALVDIAALAVLGVALAMGVPWETVSPALYALIGARVGAAARKALEPPAPPASPPSSSGQAPPASPPPPGLTLPRLALTSGVVALLLAVPAAVAARARS